MRKFFVVLVMALASGACETIPEIAVAPLRDPDTTVIELFAEGKENLCVRKTRTQNNNCSRHKDDKSCNIPKDQIIWVWKKSSITAPFRIEPKPGNTSPFEPGNACTGEGSLIVCRIQEDPDVDVFDYNVVVNPGTPQECPYDPRILIY